MAPDENMNTLLVGGRYRNRKGGYEVRNVEGGRLWVRYDDGSEAVLTVSAQLTILNNMKRESLVAAPYAGDDARNRTFFRSIGFLAKRATMLEAIVHPRAQAGFVETFRIYMGRLPHANEAGYYVHDNQADKWGNELRVTFGASQSETDNLDFGPEVGIVANPGQPGSWRINRNFFWWRLLGFGFRMGGTQDTAAIRTRVPYQYQVDYDQGIAEAAI